MRRTSKAAAVAAAVVATTTLSAGPAAADHIIGVYADTTVCAADVFSGFWGPVDTKKVRIVDSGDGTITATCTFHGIPAKRYSPYVESTWYRPPAGHVQDSVGCSLWGRAYEDLPAYDESYGILTAGRLTYDNGRATAVCVFDTDGDPA